MQISKNNIKRIGINKKKNCNNLTRIVQTIGVLQGYSIAIKNIRTLTYVIGNGGKPGWGAGPHNIAYSENGEIPNYFSSFRNTNTVAICFPTETIKGK